jgi:hypothetical protein
MNVESPPGDGDRTGRQEMEKLSEKPSQLPANFSRLSRTDEEAA